MAAQPGDDAAALQADAEAANTLSAFLAVRDVPSIEAAPAADLCVVCGSSVLATAYAAVHALQLGKAPHVLISGGVGHSTVHLYESVHSHPTWGRVVDTSEGRFEAQVGGLAGVGGAVGVACTCGHTCAHATRNTQRRCCTTCAGRWAPRSSSCCRWRLSPRTAAATRAALPSSWSSWGCSRAAC
jgi:hypothetical protein